MIMKVLRTVTKGEKCEVVIWNELNYLFILEVLTKLKESYKNFIRGCHGILVDWGTILFSRTNENPLLSKTRKTCLKVCLLITIFSFQYQFSWYYLCVLLTVQQSLNGEFLNLFIFLPIFDSICILQNEKLFLKIIIFQLNILAILLCFKLFIAVLYIISSSLSKRFHLIYVRYFICLSWI